MDELNTGLDEILKELTKHIPPAPLAADEGEPHPQEDIISDDWDAVFATEPEETQEQPEEPLEAPEQTGEQPEQAEDLSESLPEEPGRDTIRLDEIRKVVSSAAGPHNEPVHIKDKKDRSPTMSFKPIQPGTFGQQEVEPFSKDWEPEYQDETEDALEDFDIPIPVIHRPKSRLKELRDKLVSGPEKRYYELSEQGIRKLQTALLFNVLILLFSAVFTAMFALGVVPPVRLRLLVFGQFLAMMLSALLGCYQLMDGIVDLFRRRFTPNTLLFITFIVCCVDGVLCLQQLRVSVCAAFCLEMTMALWAALDKRNTEMGQMDTLRRATNLNGLACVENDYDGMMGFRICRGEVEHFMEHYQEESAPERVLNGYCIAVSVTGLAIGVIGGLLHGFSIGVQMCCATLMVGFPATAFLTVVRPIEVLEKRLHKLGTVLCGWQGVKAVRRRVVVPLNDHDLFPSGAVKLNGMKFYGDMDPDLVVTYTAALINENGGTLVDLFSQLRDSRGGRFCQVDNVRIYTGGISGEIGDLTILVGTLQLMQDMGIDMGRGTRVNQAVYTAIDGELSGVFAVTYEKAKSSAAGVRTICSCRSMTPVMTTKDFMITESFIRSRFTVNTRRIAFPDRQTSEEICARQAPEDAQVIALTTKEGLAPMAFAITGARTLGSAMRTGVAIHLIGGMLGMIIMAALAYIGAVELLSPLNILLYHLIWMIPGFLITEWTRTI